jgi:hypothetical protein
LRNLSTNINRWLFLNVETIFVFLRNFAKL